MLPSSRAFGRKTPVLVEIGRDHNLEPIIFHSFGSWQAVCSYAWQRREKDEDQVTRSDVFGRKFDVRRPTVFLRSRRWTGLWLLCRSATSGSGRLCTAPMPWPRLHFCKRVLVSIWAALCMAGRLLGSSTVCARVLGWISLLRPQVLRWPLAPLTWAII